MAAAWQRWFPFHIDRFRGSPDVQAMHPAARAGFLYLLAAAWQSDSCSLPDDDPSLCVLSGLGDLWQEFRDVIRRKFTLEDTRLVNGVLLSEWLTAKRTFERRKDAADHTNRMRRPRRNARKHAALNGDRSGDRNGDRHTYTGTGTEKKKISSASTGAKSSKSPSDPKHALFRAAIEHYWKDKNPGVEMPWDGSEGKQLSALLKASPNLTIEALRAMLHNRLHSEGVNHSERPRVWIGTVNRFANGPLNRFGQPAEKRFGITGEKVRYADAATIYDRPEYRDQPEAVGRPA